MRWLSFIFSARTEMDSPNSSVHKDLWQIFVPYIPFVHLKSGRIAFKVWMHCFQSLDAQLLKSGRGVSIGRKRGFWWMEDGTGFWAALYWYGWQGRLHDYRITPCFLNPGFPKLHIYTIYLFNYILLFIYIHIFIY